MACSSCISITLPQCPEQIVVNAGLLSNTQYRWEMTDKFDKIYNGISITDGTGILAIDVIDNADIPKGLFMPFSGVFILKAYQWISAFVLGDAAQFTVNDVDYDCVELRFRDYRPSVSYFDPNMPVYVSPIATPTIVEFTNQTTITVNHNLHYRPFVTIYDLDANVIGGNIQHTSNDQFVVTFESSESGTIYYR